MNLLDFILGRGINFSWTIPWTGAEADKCVQCRVIRREHANLNHNFVEEQ